MDRYYALDFGKWIRVDPIGVVGGGDYYSFLNNNSIDNNDYLGLHWKENSRRKGHHYISKEDRKKIIISKFMEWYAEERRKIYDKDQNIKNDAWITRLEACPYRLIRKKECGLFFDQFIIPDGWEIGLFFPLYRSSKHPGGYIEIRKKSEDNNGIMHSNQCIYDKNGELLKLIPPDGYSAGTADWYSPSLWHFIMHYIHDVRPFDWAKDIKMLDKYYEVRPHIWFDENERIRINNNFL